MDLPDALDLAVADLPDVLLRRPLASQDPEWLVLYDRIVVARQASRGSLRNALLHREVHLAKDLGRLDELLDNAQRIVEKLT